MEEKAPATVQDAVSPFLINPLETGGIKVESPLIDTTQIKAANEEGGTKPLEEIKQPVIPQGAQPPADQKVDTAKPEKKEAPAQDYKDYTDYSLMILERIEDGTIELDPSKVSKSMTAAEYNDAIKMAYDQKLERQIKSYGERFGEASKYVESLMKGIDPEIVEAAIDYEKLAAIPLDNDENIKSVLLADLQLKGTPQDDWDDIVKLHFEKGRAAKRAQEAQKQFKDNSDSLIEQSILAQKQQAEKVVKEANERNDQIKATIAKGTIAGYTLSKDEQQSLLDFLYIPKVYVEDKEGLKKKSTEFDIAREEYKKSVELQIAWAMFLKNRGKFDFAINKGSEKASSNFRSVLNGRSGQVSSNSSEKQSDQYKDESYFITKT